MKLLMLSNGRTTKVDDEDFERLIAVGSWHENNKGYVCHSTSKGGKRTKIYLHRFLMNAKKGYDVDHLNHDPLDNRKCNLRVCTHKENTQNRAKKSKGYHFSSRYGKWEVRLHGKYGGRYSSEEEAAAAAKQLKDTGTYNGIPRKRPMLPKGVRLMKNCSKHPYGAVTKEHGKQIYLGYFSTVEEASAAYKEYWNARNGIL